MRYRLILLPIILFMFCGATYYTNFDDGVDGEEYNSGIFDGSSRCVSNTDHVKSGKAVRFYFPQADECFGTKITIKLPDVTIIDGTTAVWGLCDFYFGEAADNPSGDDWSWSRYDTSQAAAQKIFRFHTGDPTYDPDNWRYNKGYRSIYGTGGADPRLDLEYTGNINQYQDTPRVDMVAGQWYELKFYVLYSSDAGTGKIKFWIDDVLKIDRTCQTQNGSNDPTPVADINGYLVDLGYIFSYWNGGAPKDQYAWIDDLYISFDGDPEGGGGDTTPPSASAFDPIQESDGVSLTKDPFIEFTLYDSGDGVDSSSVVVTVDGNNESADLDTSGTTAAMTFSLPLADVDTSIDYGETYAITIDADDLAANSMSQVSYNITMEVEPSGGTAFGTGVQNDSANYTEYSASWEIVDDVDACYRIDNTVYSPTSKGGLGEYTYYNGATYGDFRLEAQVKSNEADVTESAYADYNFVFGFEDEDNYFFCMFNSDSESNGVYQITEGDEWRIEEVTRSGVVINDNDWHDVKIEYENSVLNVYHDEYDSGNSPIFTTGGIELPTGYVGFGGYNDQASFDDIVITSLESEPETPANTTPPKGYFQ